MDTIKKPLKLFYDNNFTIVYSNNRSSTKSKHIDIKFLIVKEIVQNGQLSIKHVGTNSMVVDSLIKELPSKQFHKHTARMSVVSIKNIQF